MVEQQKQEAPGVRGGARYMVLGCPQCRNQDAEIAVTGETRKVLFNFQEGKTQGRPRFSLERDGHLEAELQCRGCRKRWWSISPIAIEDAEKYKKGGEGAA